MKGKLIIFVCLMPFLSFSQEDSTQCMIAAEKKIMGPVREVNPSFSISGFIDAYYSFDFAEPFTNEKPSFFYNHTRHNELSVNLALINMNYQTQKVRANVGLMAGTYAQYNLAHEQDLMRHIFEANAGVQLVKDLWLDAGVFGSHLGFESAISSENITLTRSLMAENSPYYLSGAKLTYEGVENWTFLAVVSNGWQNMRESLGNNNKAIGTQVVFEPNGKLLFNYSNWLSDESSSKFIFVDPRGYRIFNDAYLIYNPIRKMKIITAFDYGMEQNLLLRNWNVWYAPAVLVGYDLHEKISTGARGEYYSDEHGVNISTGTANGFQTLGVSLNLDYKPVENAFFRIECKFLNSRDAIFQQQDFSYENNNVAITTSLAVKF